MAEQTYYGNGTRAIEDSIHEELEREREEIKQAFEQIKTDLADHGITNLGTVYEPGDHSIQGSVQAELERERNKISEAFSKIKTEMENAGLTVDTFYEPEDRAIQDSIQEELSLERTNFDTGFQGVQDKVEELANMSSTLYDPSQWNNLLHYYPLNGDGTDEAGSQNLSAVGSPSYVSAVGGDGAQLNGTDQKFEITSPTGFPNSGVTFAGWINFNSFHSGSGNPSFMMAMVTDSGSPGLTVGKKSSGDGDVPVSLMQTGNGFSQIEGTTALSTSTDYFLAVTYDGSTHRLFVDGTEVASGSISGNILNANSLFELGYNQSQSSWTDANYVDEQLVFDTALSQADIDSLYQAGV